MVVGVVSSLQPNHPGVRQVVVDEVEVVVVVVAVVVAVSSKQPHQPGVLQVAVRVFERKVDVFEVVVLDVVVVSLPLLSKYFQL